MSTITKADVKEFVETAHGDLTKLQRLLAEKPRLLTEPNGNETALGAACQMRRPDILEFVLGQGEVITLSAACVLGRVDLVTEFLDADPTLLSKGDKKAHNKHPVYFAENQPEVLALLQSRGAK
jgi:hypothetical protein